MADARLEPFMTPALAAALTAALLVVVVPVSLLGLVFAVDGEQVATPLAAFPGAPLVVLVAGVAAAVRRSGRPLAIGGAMSLLFLVAPWIFG
jgi:hypothetical protein